MRELLLVLILSFLVFLNVRLWGVHEFSVHDNECYGRVTCDIPVNDLVNDLEAQKSALGERILQEESAYIQGASIESVLSRYNYRPQLSEVTIHQLMRLIATEMDLIERIIYPLMGSVHPVVREKKKMLCDVLPTTKLIFDMVLTAAANSDIVDRQVYKNKYSPVAKLHTLLNREDKKLFLHTTYQRLADTKNRLNKMLYHAVSRNFGHS